MKLASWNVNGLRSCLTKGFLEYVNEEQPDILCLQETKLQPEQAVFDLEGYHRYFHPPTRRATPERLSSTGRSRSLSAMTSAATSTGTRGASSRRNTLTSTSSAATRRTVRMG